MMPAVSVVLPTYNRVRTLERAVHSVLAQSFTDLELIVVDDGSRDNTHELMTRLADSDRRVRYIKHPANLGQSRARNTGISSAAGKFIAFQDSDDEWLPAKLGRQVEALEELPGDVGMVYCFVYYVSAEGISVLYTRRIMPDEPELYKKGLQYQFRGIGIQACLFRREVFNVCGGFDENMRGALDDTELLIRVSRNFKFSCVDEPLVKYYKTPGALTAHYEKILDSALYIFDKYAPDIRGDKSILAAQYYRISKQMKKVGRRTEARRYKMLGWVSDMLSRFG